MTVAEQSSPPAARSSAPSPAEQRLRWALVEPHRGSLLAIARRRTLNDADAEDCVSEALLRAVQAPHLDAERVGAFLCTTVVRLAADSHRQRERHRRAVVREAAQLTTSDDTPQDRVCEVDEAHWLVQQLLGSKGREAQLMQARMAGRSVVEAAQALGISAKAAENAWTRLRKKGLAKLAATASAAGFVLEWARRPATVAVPAVLACAVLAVGETDRAVPQTGGSAARDHAQDRPLVEDRIGRSALPATPGLGPVPATAEAHSAGRRSDPARVAGTPDLSLPEAAEVGSLTVDRHDADRSLLQSLSACLARVDPAQPLVDPCAPEEPDAHVTVRLDVGPDRTSR